MTLILCPECTHNISSAAVFCPSCGYPLKNTPKKRRKLPNGTGSIKHLSGRRSNFPQTAPRFFHPQSDILKHTKKRIRRWFSTMPQYKFLNHRARLMRLTRPAASRRNIRKLRLPSFTNYTTTVNSTTPRKNFHVLLLTPVKPHLKTARRFTAEDF